MIRKDNIKENITNKNLKSVITKVLSENSQENQNLLVDELLGADLYVLVDFEQGKDNKISSITMLKTINADQESYLPVFTDVNEMESAQKSSGFEETLVSFNELYEIVCNKESEFSGFIINPGSDEIIIDKELLTYIKENKLNPEKNHKVVIKDTDDIEVSKLSEDLYPTDMINALKKYFEKNQNISKAYITYIKQEGSQSYLLVTDFEGDKEKTFREISDIAKPYLYQIYLDQLEYNTTFGKEITSNLKPFYRKKIFGIF